MSQFQVDLRAFSMLAEDRIEQVFRQSAFDLFSSIVFESPVDTGTFRNNWTATISGYSRRVVTRSSAVSLNQRINAIRRTVFEGDYTRGFYFANNLPYARRLEFDGWSAQAPRGMVRVNVTRWPQIVTQNARLAR